MMVYLRRRQTLESWKRLEAMEQPMVDRRAPGARSSSLAPVPIASNAASGSYKGVKIKFTERERSLRSKM